MMPPMVSPLRWAALRALPLAVAALAVVGGGVCAKSAARPAGVPSFRLKVVRSYPHDPTAFTQGLLFLDGKLYESTGLFGRSSLRRVDLASGQVERRVPLPADHFGEGLALVGQRLIQLTWKNGKALVWDLGTMKKEAELSYDGEGWGLCYDGRQLIMSDGTDRLTLRDPTTFAHQGELRVRLAGRPLVNLNELECAGDVIYANVWQDTHIARIDRATGQVTGWIDAAGLLEPGEAARADVLNGIAAMPTTGNLLVTGKLWPRLFEVEVVPAGQDGPSR
jgi:glutaminyl-peptide cyclotransferase